MYPPPPAQQAQYTVVASTRAEVIAPSAPKVRVVLPLAMSMITSRADAVRTKRLVPSLASQS